MTSVTGESLRRKPWEEGVSGDNVIQHLPENRKDNGYTEYDNTDVGPIIANNSTGPLNPGFVIGSMNSMNPPYNNNVGLSNYNSPFSNNNGYFTNDGYGMDYRSLNGSRYGGMYSHSYSYPYNNTSQQNNITESTQATFRLLENIVGTFTSFAQMLESTYMATHNSFFSLISVAEQFGMLKETFASAFDIFKIRKLLRKIRSVLLNGKLEHGTITATCITSDEDNNFELPSKQYELDDISNENNDEKIKYQEYKKDILTSSIPLRPFMYTIVALIAIPILIKRHINLKQLNYIKSLKDSDFKKINGFAILKYDYIPEDLRLGYTLKKNDIVSIVEGYLSDNGISNWLKIKNKEGKVGLIPNKYVDLLKSSNMV
ncbi:hypothetical protein TPHA_0E01070 [Tetrapisispora phaffii CBS 4417]|uniref:Peroxisomal membrane protein PEX13 n=1 Tax=Tetrapisispora phaffii (strain ATCC 24235 / CBS 4417 / NBRC 1672 / NRRL Y-8282 / UCD 70-5) TaxID=1071381 RepID=G8BTH3_TETPH|nr:hypothetical protein TPHA_0E01070 [Tetrapisispora phaffii CBS 4417]CCE63201.1 hypothetical protein TPHA_0E01070 [Tetrapisispora phaffii CBS 4417]